MSKFFPLQRLLIASLFVIPVAIFFGARSAASWRPQFIGVQPNAVSFSRDASFLLLSPDEKWLVSSSSVWTNCTLWDLSTEHKKRPLGGTRYAAFSSDSRYVVSSNAFSQKIFLDDSSRTRWAKDISVGYPNQNIHDLHFTSDNNLIQYRLGDLIFRRSVDTSNLRSKDQKQYSPSLWDEFVIEDKANGQRRQIAFTPSGSKRPLFSFGTSKVSDQWQLAPDGLHLWVSLIKLKRFDIRDAKTGWKLWSYSSKDVDSQLIEFACYPSWEDGGKTLATIENDTLLVRDSQTGKVILSHKNNLPAPLKSWAFTHEESAVYLMGGKGEIFRQRLR